MASASSRVTTVLLLAFAAVLACQGRAGAETVPERLALIQTQLNAVQKALNDAALHIYPEADRLAASQDLTAAQAAAAQLLALAGAAETATTLGTGAKKVLKAAQQIQKKIETAITTVSNAASKDAKALKAVQAAAAAGAALTSNAVKMVGDGPLLILEEVKAKSAGFFYPKQRQVTYRVHHNGLNVPDPAAAITVANAVPALGTQSVIPQPFGVRVIDEDTFEFTVLLGAEAGGANVNVTVGSYTSTRLVFNYGALFGVKPPEPVSDISQFDGTYTGKYSGTIMYEDEITGELVKEKVSGPVEFTVANGQITVTEPGPGAGTISVAGSADFATGGGGGGVAGAAVRFSAFFFHNSLGVSANGGWSCSFSGPDGGGSGGWTAGRD